MKRTRVSWPLDLDEEKIKTLDELLEEMETEDEDVVVDYEGEFEDITVKVTSGDLLESEHVTYGDMNVTSGNVTSGQEQNNNNYVHPFNLSDTAKQTPTMANQQAQLAASLASQPVPQPGKTPASTPNLGAVNRRQANTATGSTSATKNAPNKKKKDKTGPAQEEVVTISKKHLTELLKLPEQV